MAITSEYYFPSSDGKTLIHVNQWTPNDRKIIGVVQIAHGVAEYGGRYAPFARYLCAHGYVVVANDHLGHGLSVIDGAPWCIWERRTAGSMWWTTWRSYAGVLPGCFPASLTFSLATPWAHSSPVPI